MPTTYKVLGQTEATAASATLTKNLVIEPTFESLIGSNVSVAGAATADAIIALTTLQPNWNQFANTTNTAVRWSDYAAATASLANVPTPYSGKSFYVWNTSASTFSAGICNGPAFASTGRTPNNTVNLNSTTGAMPVSGSTTYYFGSQVARIGTSTISAYHEVAWYDANLAYISWSTGNVTSLASAGWTRASFSATSPANAAYAVLFIYTNINSSRGIGIDDVWFSNVAGTATTFPTPSTTSSALTAPFTDRFLNNWSGTANSSTTIQTYAGASVDLYTVPAATQTVVSTVSVANLGLSATTYRIAVVPSGETLAKKHFVVFDGAIPANTTEAVTIGMTLATGDKIKVASDSNNVSFSAFGSELS